MATGVYTAYKKDGTEYYRVSLTCQNKHISLGSFDDYKTAAAVYSEANAIVRDEKSSHFVNAAEKITSYSSCTSALAFEKFMILLNLRDNNIYIKTPVYLCDKYFLYFFSPEIVLTFDIEDLFYYSGHKIMSRGGYFFVNDFGMQTSILARFGIRSHSVKGKDYLFRNGDEHDFRYSNVAVVNRYNGVEQIEKNGRILYRTRIHINGNLPSALIRRKMKPRLPITAPLIYLQNSCRILRTTPGIISKDCPTSNTLLFIIR